MSINVSRLGRAIERRLGVPPSRAAEMAQRVLSYFGFESRIIDNLLEPEDRKLFYELFDAGLLRSSIDTVVLPSGRNWRIFYWELEESALDRPDREPDAGPPGTVYPGLPAEAWRPRASAG